MTEFNIAKDLLIKEAYSLVIYKDGKIIMTSKEKGLKPIMVAIAEYREEIKGAILADKIIGKAAALLCIYGGIKEVYAHTLSDCAKEILQKNGVRVESNRVVPYIINREGNDKCPMEKLVENIEVPEDAHKAVLNFISKQTRK